MKRATYPITIPKSVFKLLYRLGPVNSNTVNSKLTLNSNFLKDLFAKSLPFHV